MVSLALIAAVLLGCALYAHVMLASHVAGAGKLVLARGVLIAVGTGFGLVMAAGHEGDPWLGLLAGLAGFGSVHFPAALILALKHARGAGRS